MKKRNGFTLVELLAVIVILAIIISMGSIASVKAINSAKIKAAKIRRGVLVDAAEAYGTAELSNVKNNICPDGFDPLEYNNYSSCYQLVTVKELKDNLYYEDEKNECKDDTIVIIYNDSNEYISAEIITEDSCMK